MENRDSGAGGGPKKNGDANMSRNIFPFNPGRTVARHSSSLLFLTAMFAQGISAAPPPTGGPPPIFETLRDYDPGGRVTVDYSRVGENRFANAGIEQIGGDGAPAAWKTVGAATVITQPVRAGRRALRLENPAWPKTDGRLIQKVDHVQGGGSYRAAIYMRSPAGARNVNIKFEVSMGTGKYLGGFRSEHFTVSDSAGWVRIEYTHKLPARPDLSVTVLFRLWGPGPLLLDDASFELVSQEPLHLPSGAAGQRLAQASGLLAWTAPLPTRITAQHAVDLDKANAWPTGELRLRLAGNETGILPLFLTAAGTDFAEISVEVETGAPKAAMRAHDLKLFTVEPFQYLGDLYYDVLVPARPFALPSGTSKMVWLSVYMPPGAGRRPVKGDLVLRSGGGEVLRVPFRVDVFGFDLPHEPSLPFSVGIPRPGRRVRAAERRQWLRDIARHRLSIRHLAAPRLRFDGDTPVIDFSAFDADLAFAADLGMGLFQLPFSYVAWGHGSRYVQVFGPIDAERISDRFRRRFVNAMRALAEHLERKGVLDRFNHNLFDEPYPKHYAQVRELAGLLKQANPRYRPSVYGVGRAAADGELAGCIEEPIGAGWDPTTRELLRRRGALVTVYNPLQTFDITRRPELVRGFAWWAFRCRIDRVYQWCIGPPAQSMRAHDYGSAWVFENPGHDAFLSTVRFEMLREGLEDHDYLTLFQRALEGVARKLKVKDVDSREIADRFAAQLSGRQIMKQCTEPAKYERLRAFLGSAIEWLRTPPLALFRVRPGKTPAAVRLELWAARDTRMQLGVEPGAVVSGSGSVEVLPDPTGMVDLVVVKGHDTKRLRLPVR